MRTFAYLALAGAAAIGLSASAQAQLTTYAASDNSVSSLAQMTNSVAKRAQFDAAAPGLSTLTFESATPAGVTISGGTITNTSCGAVCGFNTTAGGANFLYLSGGGTVTFTFATAINAFGLYVTGLQTDIIGGQTLTFSDGSSQTIATPGGTNGGGAFIGFTDIGKLVTSVSYNAGGDIVSIDDVRYGVVSNATGVPEPTSWAMMIAGFGVVGGAMRVRSRRVALAA